jgi:hypothetical protein
VDNNEVILIMKKPRAHWFWDKLLETNKHAKGNNALNMKQLYCEQMKKVHSNGKIWILSTYVFKVQNMCKCLEPRFEG